MRALVTAPVASPGNGLALLPPRPREEEQEGALIVTRSQAGAPTTTTSFSVLPSLRSVKCPKPAAHSPATTRQPEMLGSKEAHRRAVARQGRGLTRAVSGNTSHIPSALGGQSAQPSPTLTWWKQPPESLKAILSSERSLGAHQPGWTRAPRWGRSLERGSRGRSLEQRRARTSAAIVPKQQLRKVSKWWGASAWLEAGFLKCLMIE